MSTRLWSFRSDISALDSPGRRAKHTHSLRRYVATARPRYGAYGSLPRCYRSSVAVPSACGLVTGTALPCPLVPPVSYVAALLDGAAWRRCDEVASYGSKLSWSVSSEARAARAMRL